MDCKIRVNNLNEIPAYAGMTYIFLWEKEIKNQDEEK